jgi:hypothetical protein
VNPYPEEAKTPWYKSEFFITRPVKLEEIMNFSRQSASIPDCAGSLPIPLSDGGEVPRGDAAVRTFSPAASGGTALRGRGRKPRQKRAAPVRARAIVMLRNATTCQMATYVYIVISTG